MKSSVAGRSASRVTRIHCQNLPAGTGFAGKHRRSTKIRSKKGSIAITPMRVGMPVSDDRAEASSFTAFTD
jgi:hypothetical protein